MSAQTIVSRLKQDIAPDWSRTKLLDYLNRAQNEIFNSDTFQTLFVNKDDTDFPVPILSTTAGTLDYTPSESNLVDSDGNAISLEVNGYPVSIRRVAYVFIQTSGLTASYDNSFIGRLTDLFGVNENWTRKIYKNKYRRIPLADNKILSGLESARIVFAEDPGTYTDRYFIAFYFGAVPLTSEAIPLSINEDEWYEALQTAVQGYIEMAANGRTELLKEFRRYWIPMIRNSFNRAEQERRPFYFNEREAL